jgi:rod shape-determining protein MreC
VYADERKLFALISLIIMTAILALVQINDARAGREGPIIGLGSSAVVFLEDATSAVARGTREAVVDVVSVPGLARSNAELNSQVRQLREQNAQLREQAAEYRSLAAVAPVTRAYPDSVIARIVGFPPENESQTVTIDRGSVSGIKPNDGVIAAGGVVGRIQSVGPLSSTVLLVTDYTSRLPAMVREGRWWGIAQGNLTSVVMHYVSQDASLRRGDVVVTGNGRSFVAGIPIGTVIRVERSDAALYQSAVVRPAIELGQLDRVVVLTKR